MSLTRTVDSILVRETVLIRERPDTVTVERERTVWRERTRHDTVSVTMTDTIRETVTVEKVVEVPAEEPESGALGWMAALAMAAILAAHIASTRRRPDR